VAKTKAQLIEECAALNIVIPSYWTKKEIAAHLARIKKLGKPSDPSSVVLERAMAEAFKEAEAALPKITYQPFRPGVVPEASSPETAEAWVDPEIYSISSKSDPQPIPPHEHGADCVPADTYQSLRTRHNEAMQKLIQAGVRIKQLIEERDAALDDLAWLSGEEPEPEPEPIPSGPTFTGSKITYDWCENCQCKMRVTRIYNKDVHACLTCHHETTGMQALEAKKAGRYR
jgi:hypothetical protein